MTPDISAFIILPEHPTTFEGALDLLAQAVQQLHGDMSSQDTSPVSIEYHVGVQDILVSSPDSAHALIQVETADIRRSYAYDTYATTPLVINEFLDPDSDAPSRSFALKPIAENVPILMDVYDYISRTANQPRS